MEELAAWPVFRSTRCDDVEPCALLVRMEDHVVLEHVKLLHGMVAEVQLHGDVGRADLEEEGMTGQGHGSGLMEQLPNQTLGKGQQELHVVLRFDRITSKKESRKEVAKDPKDLNHLKSLKSLL